MPITPFLSGQTFQPEIIEVMAQAFRASCQTLGLADRDDPMNEIVARKIIEIAKTGERDLERLCEGALEDLPTVSASTFPQPDVSPPELAGS